MKSGSLLEAFLSQAPVLKDKDSADRSHSFDQLMSFVQLVETWNKTHNLTAIRNREEFIRKHIIDSLALLDFINPLKEGGSLSVLDFGSGAGFPGIPLAIVDPQLRLLSVDSALKRIVFQKMVVRSLGLENVVAQHDRVEALENVSADVITCRAVSSILDIVGLSARHLSDRGAWLLMKGQRPDREISEFETSILADTFYVSDIHQINLPFMNEERHIVQIQRVS